jgi:hypothetical protein
VANLKIAAVFAFGIFLKMQRKRIEISKDNAAFRGGALSVRLLVSRGVHARRDVRAARLGLLTVRPGGFIVSELALVIVEVSGWAVLR